MKKAIIIGSSSGIGWELAKVLSSKGYILGLAARRLDKLKELQGQLNQPSFIQSIDLAEVSAAMGKLQELITTMGGTDLIVISSGTGHINFELDFAKEKETIDVNVVGFSAMASVAMHHFIGQGYGHLVGISSIAALRGGREAPSYNASKAFVTNYLEGIRCQVKKRNLPIAVTDIQPGFVNTAMAQGEGLFWVASPAKAALQIAEAIQRKKRQAVVTRRWWFIACLLKMMPEFIYEKI